MTEETKIDPSHIPGICDNCHKGKALPEHGYLCQACYDDGWRAGQDMVDAFRADPELGIDDEGRISVIPDYKKKWGDQNKP